MIIIIISIINQQIKSAKIYHAVLNLDKFNVYKHEYFKESEKQLVDNEVKVYISTSDMNFCCSLSAYHKNFNSFNNFKAYIIMMH